MQHHHWEWGRDGDCRHPARVSPGSSTSHMPGAEPGRWDGGVGGGGAGGQQ